MSLVKPFPLVQRLRSKLFQEGWFHLSCPHSLGYLNLEFPLREPCANLSPGLLPTCIILSTSHNQPAHNLLNRNRSVYLEIISTPRGYTAFSRVGNIRPTQVLQFANKREDFKMESKSKKHFTCTAWPSQKNAIPPSGGGDARPRFKLGRSPGEGNGSQLQYSCLETSMDRGVWWATVHGSQKIRHDWACTHTWGIVWLPIEWRQAHSLLMETEKTKCFVAGAGEWWNCKSFVGRNGGKPFPRQSYSSPLSCHHISTPWSWCRESHYHSAICLRFIPQER